MGQVAFRSATLNRNFSDRGSSLDTDDLGPGSSATLPSGAGGSNRRSALKSADRPDRPKVSKHLRFTTLTLITFILLLAAVLGDPRPLDRGPHRWNVIRPSLATRNAVAGSGNRSSFPQVLVHVTLWLPTRMRPPSAQQTGAAGRAQPVDANRRTPRQDRLTRLMHPDFVQLWLNATSRTEIWLDESIERQWVHIYDAVNANNMLSSRVCRQRYACEHSCDPGSRHDCICQRGYRPAGPGDRASLMLQSGPSRLGNLALDTVQSRICMDVDECASPSVRQDCARLSGVCTNRPGDHVCLCPSGRPCLACDATCPAGYWASGSCERSQPVECIPCSGECPTGMYQVKPCGPRSDRVCRACRPLCISQEFEFTPCKGKTNRVCKPKEIIPELVVPYKKNIWFENLQRVRDISLTLTPEDVTRLPRNKSVTLDRSSGYQVLLEFDSLNLLPVLGPVDHSNGNDNVLFLASAAYLDQAQNEEIAQSLSARDYHWSATSTADLRGGHQHAYTLKANATLGKFCPYPVPPLYRLGLRVHRNVTVATVPDASLPGHRPILASCKTYRQHGHFPSISINESPSGADDDVTRYYSHSYQSPHRAQADSADKRDTVEASAPVVACLESARLPALFGGHWNNELSTPRTLYHEEKQLCGQLKQDCQHCLSTCAEQLKTNSLQCRPTANPADNGRSPRLENCFDCCARDNCSDVCDKYPAHRCQTQLCSHGIRLDFPLQPEWPKQGEFLCHVHPASSRLVYRFQWSLLYHGRALTQDRFPAALLLPSKVASESREFEIGPVWPAASGSNPMLGERGLLSQVFRSLLHVDYQPGLKHLPDLIGGTDTMQSAYFWSKQTIPLVAGSAAHANFDPLASTASATGAIYANTMQTPSSGIPLVGSLQVWPNQPFGVSTAAWARLTGAPCAAVDPLLDQLNVYTPSLPPYIAMSDVKVEYVGNYLYTVSHTKNEPKLSIGIPRSASLLGAVFSPASVERGQYLHASLILAWLSEGQGENGILLQSFDTSTSPRQDSFVGFDWRKRYRYWVIDLTGQVDQLPGLFRLRVFSDSQRDGDPGRSVGGARADAHRGHATVRVEDPVLPQEEEIPEEDGSTDNGDDVSDDDLSGLDVGELLLDYDVGVFEERKFQTVCFYLPRTQLRVLIPGPAEEPDYEQAFRLVIMDAKNRLDIRVKRTVQLPEEMLQRRIYERLPDYENRPALVDLLPSLAAKQLTDSTWVPNDTPEEKVPSIDSTQYGTKPSVSDQFGPPPMLVYTVVGLLVLMLLLLLPGLFTETDSSLTWMKPTSCGQSVVSDPAVGSESGGRVALITNPLHGYHNSSVSRWFRVCILMGYLCCKSAYSFGVTLTALVIVMRCVIHEPASQLVGIPEWIGLVGGPGEVSNSLPSSSRARQILLEDEMDVHLQNELARQHAAMRQLRETCDRGMDRLFDQLDSRLSAASSLADSRRSRVLLSQAVAELARAAATASTLQLAEGLLAFNQSTNWVMQRLHSDLVDTERALANSDWLTGARILYAEVVRLRRQNPNPSDATRSFLAWAKLAPTGLSLSSLASGLPQLTLPSQIPVLQANRLRVPTPPKRMSPTQRQYSGSVVASSRPGTSDLGVAADSRMDLTADEPEYGPKYIPFTANPVQLETFNTVWSSYKSREKDRSGYDDISPDVSSTDQPVELHRSIPPGNSSGASPSTTVSESKGLLSDFQLNWVHVLGVALLLDALWLIHRVLHTVDTAERLLYGEAVYINLTQEGLRRRLSEQKRVASGCRRVLDAAMQPGVVRKVCVSILALLVVTQCAAHTDRLLSAEMLDYIGYYDNLVLPVHLHARMVNVQVSRSAQRLNEYELAGLETEVSRRLREAQFLLHQYTDWLSKIEEQQCRLLLAYKAAAQHVRTRMASKLVRNPTLGQLHLPVEVEHTGHTAYPEAISTFRTSHPAGGGVHTENEAGISSSMTLDALVPRHCRITQTERDQELVESRRLDSPECPLSAVVPNLFEGYNVTEYFADVVNQSEIWLLAARRYFGGALYCIFVYISGIVLWNVVGSVVWFYINRFKILPKRLFFESDYASWIHLDRVE